GAVYCLQEALKRSGRPVEGLSVAVQGFGNVGAGVARFAAELGAKVVAVSDSSGGVFSQRGVDVAAAIAHKRAGRPLAEWDGGDRITNEELVVLECDVLAPCALEQAITSENADRIRARMVLEGANNPTTPAADEILEAAGID